MAERKKVLVAPLNWGLGHATRCIPIIEKLLERDIEVIIAASERPYHLLKKEFPKLQIIYFPNYDIDYPEQGNMGWHLFKKVPEVFSSLAAERRKLKRLIWKDGISGVLSDNRLALSSSLVPCVIMSHQLEVQMPAGWTFMSGFFNLLNRRYMKRFNLIWIPDAEGEPNLTGNLSHLKKKPKRVRFLGPISRFKTQQPKPIEGLGAFDLLISISGPEPQRTILEKTLTEQAATLNLKTLMVVGRTEDGDSPKAVAPNITKIGHLPGQQMQYAMAQAKYIVCRSGYTTIMDLAALNQRAAFIPTPGQTEQEYIARIYKQQGLANFQPQNKINLQELLANYDQYQGFAQFNADTSALDAAIDEFVALVRRGV